MNRNERRQQEMLMLLVSALWYAWGQIDAGVGAPVLTTGHGQEFQRLYELFIRDEQRRGFRPNIIDTWKRFVALKVERGPAAPVTQNDVLPEYHRT